ncbi:hypothetical protein MC7420_5409 [Coleofasciculus chthonoplastes PCC 7420]|uniref:Uncharacterized protein n=1 Tax=Coleofasciculus chthonoplastes PCC 7420 TaxID=118168 RepID=B4VPI9_9CYAN|nr:hypothetical protein MC7420_5409 [Coleofasciculus chthonoplastes PCC 7420]
MWREGGFYWGLSMECIDCSLNCSYWRCTGFIPIATELASD